jgi:hypothetical protein
MTTDQRPIGLSHLPDDVAEAAMSLALAGDGPGLARLIREAVDDLRGVRQPQPPPQPDSLFDPPGELTRRARRALADLDQVIADAAATHGPACWQWHAGCLASRTRRTLEGTDR